MHVNEASATIEANAETVWGVLVDGASYTEWDSEMISLEGTIAEGETITIVNEVNPKRGFAIQVTDVEPNRGMTWSGGMPLGLFRGVRTLSLSDAGDGKTALTMREEMTGLLKPLMTRLIPDLAPPFVQFANGLKAEAESRA